MKLKPFVFPFLYISMIFILIIGLYYSSRAINIDLRETTENVNYVSDVILNDTIPVVEVSTTVGNPYIGENVNIIRYYYNLDDDIDRQKESVVFYNNTYMPNTGIDYASESNFEVVAILDGEVIDIKEDEILGKIVEIRHSTELISSYAGLSEISVQKGESITIGSKIGISGTNQLNDNKGNHLHLEIYQNGLNVDPTKIIGNKLGDN